MQRFFQQIATVTVNQMHTAGTQLISRINDMLHHRFPGKGVQHFGEIGIHAGSFTSGKDHHAHSTVQHTHPDCNLSEKSYFFALKILHFFRREM